MVEHYLSPWNSISGTIVDPAPLPIGRSHLGRVDNRVGPGPPSTSRIRTIRDSATLWTYCAG